jgi:hypothetical protein
LKLVTRTGSWLMHHPPEGSTSQGRYGLVLIENPGTLVVEQIPRSPLAGTSASAAPAPRAWAEGFAIAGFALAYLATIGWFASRAVRWLFDS